MLTLLPLLALCLPSQKQATPPKPKPAPAQPKPAPAQKAVTPKARPTTPPAPRPTEPVQPSPKSDSAALNLLTSSADTHSKLTSLQTDLDWRYLSKANLAFRPTSPQGQKALEAALRSAQGTLTLTKDGQARLEVTQPGKGALPRAKTLTDTKKLYAIHDDNDGTLAALTQRAFACA